MSGAERAHEGKEFIDAREVVTRMLVIVVIADLPAIAHDADDGFGDRRRHVHWQRIIRLDDLASLAIVVLRHRCSPRASRLATAERQAPRRGAASSELP